MTLGWRYEFAEDGGYDCMSSAYLVFDPYGKVRVKIDVADFVERDRLKGNDWWDAAHGKNSEAEAITETLVSALNGDTGGWIPS